MKKNALFFTLASLMLLSLTSCEEKSLIPDDQKHPDRRNIEAYVFNYWNGGSFYFDSVYAVAGGEIQISDITMVFSDYEFSLSTADTVDADTSFGVANLRKLPTKIGLLPAGTYTGEHQVTIGYTESMFNTPPSMAPSEIKADGLLRSDVGYNHLLIRGKYRVEGDTINWLPTIPFEYRLGGTEFNVHFERPMSFSVTANNPVSIFFNLQVDMLFQGGLTPPNIPLIVSDPNDNDDYTAATLLFNNLDQALSLD
ncbi:hypothetical protein [Phaeocystidibacter marisrubri]|uniref:Uncharacterized protein n=1 Tax=Phaeocystidibacter marisrubri TaxID=1577780 RepID=A0A6L3ZI97_9FLAO|nr:hypothetical protein [Phaeocystidibacter marisrubri]KAB2817329.1 hypothetical protein F8C82_02755 [Phaeocystidibacter marisrubri]GGH75888.1 hypothetical protein GCM10011318_23380 [Phaeocystidibacter marisrubri]